jgi:NAD(P)-dependent dehydrogenase (short-subunit alcohol dehydrogenase family)
MQLKDRVAIVTGAGSGIGFAITERFVLEGARVIGADLKGDHLTKLEALTGVTGVQADVTSPTDVDRLVELATGQGRLSIVVNNAGIMDAFCPVGEVTDELWDRVIAVNLTGPMMLIRAALPSMLAAGRGVIVNISSVGGLVGGRAGAAYTASKHGLVGLTKNVAATYGSDGIRCVAVAPGGVNTGIPLGGEPSERGFATLNKTLPANPRMAEPEELANLVAFLASDQASFVNGSVVVADGGWLAA